MELIDRIPELEVKFDELEIKEPIIAKQIGEVLDRLDDGKAIPPNDVKICMNALDGMYG